MGYAEIKADRIDRAREHVAKIAGKVDLSDRGLIWDLCRNFLVRSDDAEKLIAAERLKRGEIRLADLSPAIRRALVDPDNLDLHAIAAGPIMDSNQIYLPAGRISLAEAIAREAQAILSIETNP